MTAISALLQKITLGACISAFLNKEDIDVIPCSSCSEYIIQVN